MKIEEIRTYYRECFRDATGRYPHMMRELMKYVKIDDSTRILDYGTGTGLIAHYLYNKYKCKIDAVDLDRNMLETAETAWENDQINWISIDQFTFPGGEYDVIISSQVIEHVHNVGNYLSVINKMLKTDGILMIGTPNVMHFGFLWRQMRIKKDKILEWSRNMVANYKKETDHIYAWDTYHFVTLLASCGFQIENFLPMEGVVLPRFRIFTLFPAFRNSGGVYVDSMNKGLFKNLCYTQQFIFKKVKNIEIENYD